MQFWKLDMLSMKPKLPNLALQDKLSHYKAFARECQMDADSAALASQIAERRYARANQLVRDLEKELRQC